MTNPVFFLSSTYKDLSKYRSKAITWFEATKAKCNAMEFFVADSSVPAQICLNNIENSDVFILLLGDCYGSLLPDDAISFTEMEYNEAVNSEKDIIVFMITDGASEKGKITESQDEIEALNIFRTKLKNNHTVRFVNSPTNFVYWLAMAIYSKYPELRPIDVIDHSFWSQLPIALDTHTVPDLAFKLLNPENELELIKELEENFTFAEGLFNRYREDADKLPKDLMDFLKKTSTQLIK